MTCSACHRTNLPGGVRCTYCGVPYPVALDFDIGDAPPPPTAPTDDMEERAPTPSPLRGGAGLIGALVILALKGKSLLTLLKLGKLATTFGSMFIFIVADARLFGWQFAVAIAISIFVHEMGHVFVNWRKGLKQSAPMFIPFLGAVIFIKQFPDDPAVQAESGAGGPSAGMLAAVACLVIAVMTGNPFWLAVAHIGFAINLFNLIPVWQLDGAHMTTVFSPGIWNGVLVILLLWALKVSAPMLWLILIIAFLVRLNRGSDDRYVLAPPATRFRVAGIYLVLCLGLSYGSSHTMQMRPDLHMRSGVTRSAPHSQVDSTSRSAEAPRAPQSSRSTRSLRLANDPDLQRVAYVLFGVVAALPTILWTVTSVLLRVASHRRITVTAFVMPVWMTLVGIGAYAAHRWVLAPGRGSGAALGAYYAAAGAALVYSVVVALRRSPGRPGVGLAQATTRALAWSLAGSLAVVYASEDMPLLVITMAAAAAFCARYRWTLPAAMGAIRQELGDLAGAAEHWHRAAALRPDVESAAALYAAIARANLTLKRGAPALEALTKRRELAESAAAASGAPVMRTASDLALEAAALALTDRYNEAIERCEQILGGATHEEAAKARQLVVHTCLADLARIRGWADEALAQAEWCLAAVPKNARRARGVLRSIRASALIDSQQTDAALAECDRAEKAARDPHVETLVCIVRARADLAKGRPDEALRHLLRADRLRSGDLEVRYWLGIARREAGDSHGGRQLAAIAADHPLEHWGKRAAAALA